MGAARLQVVDGVAAHTARRASAHIVAVLVLHSAGLGDARRDGARHAAERTGNGAAGGLQAVEDRVASGRGLPLTPRGCRALASVSTIAHGTAAGRLAHGALATHAGLAGLALGRSLSLLHARAIAVAVIVALLLVGSRITVVILFVSIVPHDGTSASRTIGGCVRSRQIVSVYLKSSSMPARTHP